MADAGRDHASSEVRVILRPERGIDALIQAYGTPARRKTAPDSSSKVGMGSNLTENLAGQRTKTCCPPSVRSQTGQAGSDELPSSTPATTGIGGSVAFIEHRMWVPADGTMFSSVGTEIAPEGSGGLAEHPAKTTPTTIAATARPKLRDL